MKYSLVIITETIFNWRKNFSFQFGVSLTWRRMEFLQSTIDILWPNFWGALMSFMHSQW